MASRASYIYIYIYIYIHIDILIRTSRVLELRGDCISVRVRRGTLLLSTGCILRARYLHHSYAVCVYLQFASVIHTVLERRMLRVWSEAHKSFENAFGAKMGHEIVLF